jgi:thiol-disulfide isomerase/thioredoxin
VSRVAVLLAVVSATLALAALWRARSGRVRPAATTAAPLRLLGHEPGPPTLLQFTGPDCGQCDLAADVLEDVAGTVGGVRVLTVDASDRLDVAAALGVWRVPTVLVLDRTGAETARAGGVPRHGELLAAPRSAGPDAG